MGGKNSKGRREVRLRTVLAQPDAGAAAAAPPPGGVSPGALPDGARRPATVPRPTLVAATPHGTEKIMAIDRARIFVQSDTNPFECSICLNLYNDGENIPTTFPCGHSVCLVHVPEIRRCPLCRGPIPPAVDCRPTIALRDASMLFAQVTAEAMALCQQEEDDNEGDESRKRDTDGEQVWLRRDSSWELAELQIDRHQASSSSGDFAQPRPRHDAPPPAVAATASGRTTDDVATARQTQLSRDAALAREMYSREQQERAAQLARDEELARQLQRREEMEASIPSRSSASGSNTAAGGVIHRHTHANSTPPQAQGAAAAANATRVPPRLLNCDQCGKACFLCARLKKCCACLDRRPVHDPDGTYPVYVDGYGWQNIGRRSAGYCPACT